MIGKLIHGLINRKIIGDKGEQQAGHYLRANGYEILETNWRSGKAEIDIIAKKENLLVFIEVKTRQSLKKGLPRESVNRSKQKKIIMGASFLNYSSLASFLGVDPISARSLGILIVEIGVGVAVTAVMVWIYYNLSSAGKQDEGL